MKKKDAKTEDTNLADEKNKNFSQEEFEEILKKAGERDEFHAKWLAVHSEYENTRKRLEKEKFLHMKFANEDIISRLFPIMDNFDMAFASMDKAEDKESVMEGIKMVQKEFHKILEEYGVKKIDTCGKEFDPNLHEAVLVVETNECPEGTIVEEMRAGYMLNDRLLRPAQVKVAKSKE